MLEFDLTEEQKALQRLARDFAEEEIRPIALELDQMDVRESFPWDMVKKGSKLGFRTMALPPEWGGVGADLLTQVVMTDELAYADMSCCKIFSQCWKVSRHLFMAGTEDQQERYIPPFVADDSFVLAQAITEPNSGSDNSGYYDPPPGQGLMMRAERKGDYYILNGMKHLIANGPVAKLYIIRARTDPTVNQSHGMARFIVPRDTPGFSIGNIHDKVGFRAYPNAELIFENVKVPVEDLLGGKEGGGSEETYMRTVSNIELSAHTLAVARAAFDAAVKFANERFQGGKIIIQHQAVQSALADLYIALQAGRTLLWRTAWTSTYQEPDNVLGNACKAFCADAALKITIGAMELFGGVGVMRDLPLQKYVRDALVMLHHGGGTQAMIHLKIGKALESRYQRGLALV
ncbi:MAG: acyl-CoA dehydrogenase family protein [Thermoplasmata archaeon]